MERTSGQIVAAKADEWHIIEKLLPGGWAEQARTLKAFRRARYTRDPGALLRVLLFHAVSRGGLRETVAAAKKARIVSMSQVALYKRLKTAGPWLEWIAAEQAGLLRGRPRVPDGMRVRAVDSTTIRKPASKGTDWRLHYSIDLRSLGCDWNELTDEHGAELLERTPAAKGDVLLADRNYLRPAGVRAIVDANGDAVVRMRWTHSAMRDQGDAAFKALTHARKLLVGEVGDWPVTLPVRGEQPVTGRVVATRLPAPLAALSERRVLKSASKKGKTSDKRSLEAAHFVMLFTTLPVQKLDAAGVLDLYRYRWQIELAFKRLKQLLKLGQVPHKHPDAARAWIAGKLVVALLLEQLFRNARALSPWGYDLTQPS